jgi:hypothetical protein
MIFRLAIFQPKSPTLSTNTYSDTSERHTLRLTAPVTDQPEGVARGANEKTAQRDRAPRFSPKPPASRSG